MHHLDQCIYILYILYLYMLPSSWSILINCINLLRFDTNQQLQGISAPKFAWEDLPLETSRASTKRLYCAWTRGCGARLPRSKPKIYQGSAGELVHAAKHVMLSMLIASPWIYGPNLWHKCYTSAGQPPRRNPIPVPANRVSRRRWWPEWQWWSGFSSCIPTHIPSRIKVGSLDVHQLSIERR